MDQSDLLVQEFQDVVLVLEFGANKYEPHGWLKPDATKCNHRAMHDSMFHHLSESYMLSEEDAESGLHPLLHLAARALMMYTRYKRGIIHPDDVRTVEHVLSSSFKKII